MDSKKRTLVFLFGKAVPKTTLANPWFAELERDYHVVCWNVGDILWDGLPRPPYGEGDAAKSITISTLAEFRCSLLDHDKTDTAVILTMPMVNCRMNTERIVREMGDLGYTYIVRDVTNSFSTQADLHWLKSKFRRWTRKSVLGFRNRRVWFWRDVAPPVFALVAGRVIEDSLRIQGLQTRFVRAHSRDFEHYLEITSRGARNIPSESMGAVLDGAWAGNSDDTINGIRADITKEEYYGRIAAFLERLATEGIVSRFTLCLHPGNPLSVDTVRRDLATSRCEVVKGNTSEVVARSKLVIGGCSSAFSLAVLFEKPVCHFCPGAPNTMINEQWVRSVATALGRTVNYPDSKYLDMGLDQRAYRRYRTRYVKEPDTALKSHYAILDDALTQYVWPE